MPTLEEIRARERTAGLILLGILVIALLLRIWGMGFGLPQKVHPDEPLLVDRAIEAAANGNYKTGFYHWPNFLIYMLHFEYLLTYVTGLIAGVYSSRADMFNSYFTNPTVYFWIGRITTTLFCLIGMNCLYLIGKKIGNKGAGLAAAILMGFDALFIEHSRYITPDIPAVALMIYVWYCLIDYTNSGKSWTLFSAAFIGGVAVSTKYNAGLLIVPIAIAAVSRVQYWPSGDVPRLSLRLTKYLLTSVLLFLLGFFIFTPYSLLDSAEFWRQLLEQLKHQELGHIGMETGGSSLLAAAAHFFSPYGLVLLALTLAGLPWIHRQRQYRLILLSFPVLYLIVLSGWVVWADRYLLYLLPILFLAAGITLSRISEYISNHILQVRDVFLTALITVLLVLPSLSEAVRHSVEINKTDTRVASLEWINANIPEYAPLYIEKGGPEPYHVDDVELFGLDVSPVYFYTGPELWFDIENRNEEPLVKLMRLRNPKPEYIVSSGYTHDRYYDPLTQARHQELVRPWLEYYEFIETHCELLVEFTPGEKLTGPWIKIYRVPPDALD
jgi:4-amino-4-deoxy-L-arabinose transferase-like glycosyltransferase